MRAFVFLLILGNLLFFAWAQGYFGPTESPDALRVEQQLNADKIRVVARDEPPPPPASPAGDAPPAAPSSAAEAAAETTAPVEACLRIADLSGADGGRVEALLGEQWPAYTLQRKAAEGGAAYWVYIPPLASKQEVDNKAAELKRLRVPELYIVQESGANNRAISLGLFSTREAANARLESLRALGVRSAKVGERGSRPASVPIEIRGPQGEAEALRQAIVTAVPEAHFADCGKPATP